MDSINAEKKLTYLLGDFNVNLLNIENHVDSHEFADLMFSHSLIPSITKPTRISSRSATLIDNIFSNNLQDENVFTGLLYTDISDHFPIFHIDYSNTMNTSEKIFTKRIVSDDNVRNFSAAICNQSWDELYTMNDAQEAYTYFHNIFSRIYNDSFPLKELKSGYKTRKPWLSDGMKKQIKIKNKLYKRSRKSGNPEDEKLYKTFRNRLNSNLVRTEREHYQKLLEDNKHNLKKSWRILKEVINKKQTSSSCSEFYINNQLSNDKKKIVDGFNNFFINIGPTLANDIPSDSRNPTMFMKNRIIHSMVLEPVVEEEIEKNVRNLKEGSAGWDAVSAKVVKLTYDSFINPLCHIINMSFNTGIFPTELKIARVIPLFKSGDTSLISNYRPVSVLPVQSKIFERLL